MENKTNQEVKEILVPVISTKEWVITILIMSIPLVNIVFLILWATASIPVGMTKRNYARAVLIMMGVSFLAYLIILLPILNSIRNASGY